MAHTITAKDYDAVLFDLDGVLTDTAALHAKAWKRMFDEFLRRYGEIHGLPFEPFGIETDYRSFVDGKPRYEGVSAFLESRRIVLPQGALDDSPEANTVYALGNRKNEMLLQMISAGVEPYPGSIALVDRLLADGIRCGVVSSSRNAVTVLKAAGIAGKFELVVDGLVAAATGLAGKPSPDTYLEGARLMDVSRERCVVIEDAISGVEAGVGGAFGLVVGVDRLDQREDLLAHGAHIVVDDLAELDATDLRDGSPATEE